MALVHRKNAFTRRKGPHKWIMPQVFCHLSKTLFWMRLLSWQYLNASITNQSQVLEAALKILWVCQHTQTCSPSFFITLCNPHLQEHHSLEYLQNRTCCLSCQSTTMKIKSYRNTTKSDEKTNTWKRLRQLKQLEKVDKERLINPDMLILMLKIKCTKENKHWEILKRG